MPFSYHTKVGERFGSRVITGFLKERDSDGHLRCSWKCDCGNQGIGGLKGLRHTAKCEKCRARNQKGRPTHGHAFRRTANGIGRSHLYDCWNNMLGRVRGHGRNKRWYAGISVCDAWKAFEGFRDWALSNGYKEGLSLDRIYTCRHYEPSNCEWVPKAENRRRVDEIWRHHDTTPIEMLWGTT